MYRFGVVILGFSLAAQAQRAVPKNPVQPKAAPESPARQLSPGQKFVIDTVKMATALPQSDQQDRLRVLSAAADVVSPIDKKMAKGFWNEGVRIESELVRLGHGPGVGYQEVERHEAASTRLPRAQRMECDAVAT